MTQKLLLIAIITLLCLNVNGQNNNCKLKIGTNLGGISDWMTEMPFVDMMHNARTWGTRNYTGWTNGWQNEWNTELIDLVEKDENGYPLEVPFYLEGHALEDSQIVYTVWAYIDAWEAGTYTCFFDGEGELEFERDGKIISKSSGMYKVQITPTKSDNFLEMRIKRSKRGNHIRNIRLIMPGHENSYQQQPFNPLYLEKLSMFKALRFMDWGQTNNWGNNNAWECFDSASDTLLTNWDQRSKPTYYTYSHNKGVPYELMCDLCNTLGTDMWVCVPHSASVEYIREMANLIKERLNPNLHIYAEYSNEIWNWMFGQTHWLNNFYGDGINKGWPEGIVVPIQRNLDAWTEVFADSPSRLTRVVGVQTGWQDVANRTVFNLKKGTFDAVTITGYFGLGEQGDAALDKLGSKATAADVAHWVRKAIESNELNMIKDDYTEIGAKLNVPLIYYEAGQHITPSPFGEEPSYAQALLDIQRDTALYNIYHEWFEQIEKLIPNEEQTLYMNFSFVGSLSARYGSWGILETLNQDTSLIYAPKFQALMEQINYCGKPTSIVSPSIKTEEVILSKINNHHYLLQSKTDLKAVKIMDTTGRVVAIYQPKLSNETVVDFSDKPKGIYIISITTHNSTISKQIIIE